MARFAVKTLEFDKVKNMLASKAATFLGKQAIISLQIESEFSKVKRLQEETAEALRILDEGRRFPFGSARSLAAYWSRRSCSISRQRCRPLLR